MSLTYAEFLARKRRAAPSLSQPCTPDQVHPGLHDWQRRIVAWAVQRGRAALWETTGAGKTRQQIEWARLSGRRSLIVAPLAVCQQTVREAASLDMAVRYVRSDADAVGPGVWVTNYEMFDRFNSAWLDAVVLDEASILKQSDGKTRTALIHHFQNTPRRLTATATPAPNDVEELTNQAEFLGVTTRVEMLAAYFIHDDTGWRLKGHARRPMFDWMATWAVALRRPSDIGGSDAGYILPELRIIPEIVQVEMAPADGELFRADLGGVGGRAQVRRQTLDARCARAAELVAAEPDRQWVLWCGLSDEADALGRAVPGAVNVPGNWTPEDKAKAYLDFADGRIRTIITKPSMAALGLNWQNCCRMAFVGLSDSWEQYYQAIRRCWRYGQTRPVHAHVVLSDLESAIAANIARKEAEAERMAEQLVRAMHTTEHWSAA